MTARGSALLKPKALNEVSLTCGAVRVDKMGETICRHAEILWLQSHTPDGCCFNFYRVLGQARFIFATCLLSAVAALLIGSHSHASAREPRKIVTNGQHALSQTDYDLVPESK